MLSSQAGSHTRNILLVTTYKNEKIEINLSCNFFIFFFMKLVLKSDPPQFTFVTSLLNL